MRIISERAKVSTACAGMEGFDAEVRVEEVTDKGFNTFYVQVNSYNGRSHYAVSKDSAFALLEGKIEEISFLEEYESMEDAKESVFYKYFFIADRMINELTSFE